MPLFIHRQKKNTLEPKEEAKCMLFRELKPRSKEIQFQYISLSETFEQLH